MTPWCEVSGEPDPVNSSERNLTESKPIPLITEAEQITAEWMRRALASGGVSDCPDVAALEVSKLSDVANALGNL